MAYLDYRKSVCPDCGTRYDDWDHGGEDEEDRYVATLQKCVGCEVIADKQKELEGSGDPQHGMKVALVPVSVQTALDWFRKQKPQNSEQ
ncbi:hypothetical protein [Streptomyces sp. AD55]|uniref:hypothetical protein n=1 Tax=Streptomyces sp. AD55 TaxID=3242895 RepID=UPI0035275D8F